MAKPMGLSILYLRGLNRRVQPFWDRLRNNLYRDRTNNLQNSTLNRVRTLASFLR